MRRVLQVRKYVKSRRVRDTKEGKDVELTSYKRLQNPQSVDNGLLKNPPQADWD